MAFKRIWILNGDGKARQTNFITNPNTGKVLKKQRETLDPIEPGLVTRVGGILVYKKQEIMQNNASTVNATKKGRDTVTQSQMMTPGESFNNKRTVKISLANTAVTTQKIVVFDYHGFIARKLGIQNNASVVVGGVYGNTGLADLKGISGVNPMRFQGITVLSTALNVTVAGNPAANGGLGSPGTYTVGSGNDAFFNSGDLQHATSEPDFQGGKERRIELASRVDTASQNTTVRNIGPEEFDQVFDGFRGLVWTIPANTQVTFTMDLVQVGTSYNMVPL